MSDSDDLTCTDTTEKIKAVGVAELKSCTEFADDEQCSKNLENDSRRVSDLCPLACGFEDKIGPFKTLDVKEEKSCTEFAEDNQCKHPVWPVGRKKVFNLCPKACYQYYGTCTLSPNDPPTNSPTKAPIDPPSPSSSKKAPVMNEDQEAVADDDEEDYYYEAVADGDELDDYYQYIFEPSQSPSNSPSLPQTDPPSPSPSKSPMKASIDPPSPSPSKKAPVMNEDQEAVADGDDEDYYYEHKFDDELEEEEKEEMAVIASELFDDDDDDDDYEAYDDDDALEEEYEEEEEAVVSSQIFGDDDDKREQDQEYVSASDASEESSTAMAMGDLPLFENDNESTTSGYGMDGSIKGSSSVNMYSIGFQSNWGDQSSYSGSMVYDFTRNTVYVTGTTYRKDQIPVQSSSGELPQRSTCFVGQIPIVNIVDHWKLDDPPLPPRASDNPANFVAPDSLYTTEQMGCNAILYDSDVIGKYGADYLYVGGVDETPMDDERNGAIAAFVNLYTRNSNSINWTNKRKGLSSAVPHMADMEHPCPVKYPVAMEYGYDRSADSKKGKAEIAVLNVASHDPLLTDAFIENGDVENMKINHKNSLLPPGLGTKSDPLHKDYHKRGSAFYFTLQRFTLDDEECDRNGNNCNEVVQWKSEHVFNEQPDPSKSDTDILPTGLINLGGVTNDLHYVIVGSYHGRTGGISSDKHYGWKMTSVDNDYDGFMQSLTFRSGKPMWQPIGTFSSIENSPSHLNDFIHDVCKGYDPDTGDVNSFYVVGSTFGTMPKGSIQTPDDEQPDENISLPQGKVASKEYNLANHKTLSAWVSRVDINTMKPIWTTQLYGTKHAEAFGCHVIPLEPTLMYVGGTVYDGGAMMYVRSGSRSKVRKGQSSGNSAGRDDVWVTQLDTTDGSLRWIKQLGSTGNDRISRTNGVAADLEGDCIIYGETDGDLYRSKKNDIDPTHTDIFLVQLDKIDGHYRTTTENVDKQQQEETHNMIGGMIGGVVVLLAVGIAVYFLKLRGSSPAAVAFRRRLRRKTVEDVEMADGVFTDDPNQIMTSSYKDEVENANNYLGDYSFDGNKVDGGGGGQEEPSSSSHPNGAMEEQEQKELLPPDKSTFKEDPDYQQKRTIINGCKELFTSSSRNPKWINFTEEDISMKKIKKENLKESLKQHSVTTGQKLNVLKSLGTDIVKSKFGNSSPKRKFKDDPDYRPGRNFV